MKIACSGSPDLRYSFASGAKYLRGFSSNFWRSSSIRAELAIESPRKQSGGGAEAPDRRKRIIPSADATRQSEVTSSLDFSPRPRLTLQAWVERLSRPFFLLPVLRSSFRAATDAGPGEIHLADRCPCFRRRLPSLPNVRSHRPDPGDGDHGRRGRQRHRDSVHRLHPARPGRDPEPAGAV